MDRDLTRIQACNYHNNHWGWNNNYTSDIHHLILNKYLTRIIEFIQFTVLQSFNADVKFVF